MGIMVVAMTALLLVPVAIAYVRGVGLPSRFLVAATALAFISLGLHVVAWAAIAQPLIALHDLPSATTRDRLSAWALVASITGFLIGIAAAPFLIPSLSPGFGNPIQSGVFSLYPMIYGAPALGFGLIALWTRGHWPQARTWDLLAIAAGFLILPAGVALGLFFLNLAISLDPLVLGLGLFLPILLLEVGYVLATLGWWREHLRQEFSRLLEKRESLA